MRLAALIAAGRSAQASDLHLEPGLPAGLRVRGQLRSVGEPIPGAELLAVLLGTQSVKAVVRQGQFFKVADGPRDWRKRRAFHLRALPRLDGEAHRLAESSR